MIAELDRGLAEVRNSPKAEGRIEMIVRRPIKGQRVRGLNARVIKPGIIRTGDVRKAGFVGQPAAE